MSIFYLMKHIGSVSLLDIFYLCVFRSTLWETTESNIADAYYRKKKNLILCASVWQLHPGVELSWRCPFSTTTTVTLPAPIIAFSLWKVESWVRPKYSESVKVCVITFTKEFQNVFKCLGNVFEFWPSVQKTKEMPGSMILFYFISYLLSSA